MININPFLATDGYKTGHHRMYPKGTTKVYSNFTPRSNKHAPKGCDKVVSFGQQMVMKEVHDMWNNGFFRRDDVWTLRNSFREEFGYSPDKASKKAKESIKEEVISEIKREYSLYLGEEYDVTHIEELWDLGYLPIKVKALPEGSTVPMGVPVLTISNTRAEFYWLTNFLETIISTLLWKPMTSATIAHHFYKNIVYKYAKETDETNKGLRYLAHDFSMRGLDSVFATMSSGLGHALSFHGSDSLPVIKAARYYYNAKGNVVNSVNATEHSVMCAGEKDSELTTFRYLMKQFPKGILSIVSDTWDLWKVLTVMLPILKEEILKRDGKIVIRPDSGDPVDIICGNVDYPDVESWQADLDDPMIENTPASKGVIELLWDVFGGTVNDQGYKVLDPHIGAIYGDSINAENAVQMYERLKAKGFATTNVVLGIGSFTYQYNTRDTFGFAMKATYCEVNGEGREIFKDPITDDGTKKSAKGLLVVNRQKFSHAMGDYELKDQCTIEEEDKLGYMQLIYKNGDTRIVSSLDKVRERLDLEVR